MCESEFTKDGRITAEKSPCAICAAPSTQVIFGPDGPIPICTECLKMKSSQEIRALCAGSLREKDAESDAQTGA